MKGKVKLMYDLTDGETDVPYLIPFNMYVEGSYFGDSDVLADTTNEGRDGTALVDSKSVIYVIVRKDLLQVLKMFKHSYYREMRIIAKERRIHHKSAIDELKMQNMHVRKKLIKNYKHMLMQQGARKSDIEKGQEITYSKPKTNKNIGKSSGQQKEQSSTESENDEEIEVKIDFDKLWQEAKEELAQEQNETKLGDVSKAESQHSHKNTSILVTNIETPV